MTGSVAIEKVGVIGCGLMGSGIAQVSAAADLEVVVYEADDAALSRGMERIKGSLEKLYAKGKISSQMRDQAAGHLHTATSLDGVSECDLVIEAIVEEIGAKKELFSHLGGLCKPGTIFASNTSSFPIGEMGVASGRPGRMVGLHFFNPVPLMKLVEVVRAEQTTDPVFAAVRAYAERLGKTPIDAQDTPGFVVNRLLVPYLIEAIRMLERGDATRDDIDTGMTLGCGHPMGPLTLLDYVGLDTTLSIIDGWHQRFPEDPLFVPPELLRGMVGEGYLGRKSGTGFYRWEGDKKA